MCRYTYPKQKVMKMMKEIDIVKNPNKYDYVIWLCVLPVYWLFMFVLFASRSVFFTVKYGMNLVRIGWDNIGGLKSNSSKKPLLKVD